MNLDVSSAQVQLRAGDAWRQHGRISPLSQQDVLQGLRQKTMQEQREQVFIKD